MTSSVSVRRRQNSPPDCFVILLHHTHLYDARRSTAGAGGRSLDHHALAGQMFGERLTGGAAAFESGDRGLRGKRVSLGTIFPKICLEILELHLELLDQPGMAFGALAILFTPEFGDLQSEVPDHVVRGRDDRLNLGQLPLGCKQSALCSRRAGLCRGECSAQDIDLRCALRYAENLPRNPGIVQ
jgi:hypothetical protein